MRWTGILRGFAIASLLAAAGCAAVADTSTAQPGQEVSGRVSECSFRVVLQAQTGEPDDTAGAVLDTAAEIARRTGTVAVRGTYAREEAVNDTRALEAIAMRHGGRVRDLLLERGVAPGTIRLNGLVSHPSPSQSGAYIHVCAPRRNVENGWRDRPLDPALRVPVVIGETRLAIPIVNLSPYYWNNLPFEPLSAFVQFHLDRANDPATFADVQALCWLQFGGPFCARRLPVQVQPLRGALDADFGYRHGVWESRPHEDRIVEIEARERRGMITRRWIERGRLDAIMQCVSAPHADVTASLAGNVGPLECVARALIGAGDAWAHLSFWAADEAEAEAIFARARRDLARFAVAGEAR